MKSSVRVWNLAEFFKSCQSAAFSANSVVTRSS